MKMKCQALSFGLLLFAVPLMAQPAPKPVATNNYSSDIITVHDAQTQALEQARQMLAQGEGVRDRNALESAIKEMELAQTALDTAKNSPDKLPAAIAAEQSAYQALLKVTPREYRVTQSRNGQQGGQAGQAGSRELNELENELSSRDQNRYETESQATAPQNAQQREQSQTANRLNQLAQRQQDLNDRLRELQTALQVARTDEERADLQRQLKRLQDEQRQMLANVDEMRQQLAQSPSAGSQAETQRQLEQTRTDMERAAQEMERQSASGALAAGTRAQETMQNLRNDLQRQTSSQFSEQMRQMRSQARDLTQRENEIARGLDSLNNGEHQTLDDSAARQQIVQQMAQQQTALTNLLAQMRAVSEQSEATEPLLSQQLYDTLRQANQRHTDNLLDMSSQLAEHGFLPQASQAESMARTNLTELARGIDRAADSVLGSETDALRYAQRELDDLTRQVERELGGAGTNAAGFGFGTNTVAGQSNLLARAAGNIAREGNTNLIAGANGRPASGESQSPGSNPRGQRQGDSGNTARNGNRGQQADGNNAEQASSDNQGTGQQPGQEQANAAGNGNRGGEQEQANNARGGNGQRGAQARAGGDANGRQRLRQLAVELGASGGDGGPITGGGYLYWSDRLRDVEQAVDQQDLRNQLATVRERVSAMRAEFRQTQRAPDANVVREQIVVPLTQVRVWLQDELARRENSDSLVPLDRDPVPDDYTELVRQYYEKLGSAQ